MSEGPTQRDDLEVNESADGLIVYDPQRDRVHHLNATASLVFELCTGANADTEVESLVAAAFPDADAAAVADEVRRCLVTLRDEGLIS